MLWSRERQKLLGLVIVCASIALAIILPATGVHQVEDAPSWSLSQQEEGPSHMTQGWQRTDIWMLLGGSGVFGLFLWMSADMIQGVPDRGRSRSTRRRRR